MESCPGRNDPPPFTIAQRNRANQPSIGYPQSNVTPLCNAQHFDLSSLMTPY
jgi:hypothetical protein